MEKDAFEKELFAASEQGSDAWGLNRAGRFTASEIHKLMESGSRLMTPAELALRPKSGKGSSTKFIEDPAVLSKPTLTYIRNKVSEVLTGMPHIQEPTKAMQHGDTWEPLAAEFFTQQTGLEFEILSFVPYGDYAGGSPDRKIKDRKELLEIKCPYNSWNQVDYLMLTDQWDLKREYPEYYWQSQGNLLFTGFEICHWVSFDYRMTDEKNKMVYIPIKPVAEDQELILKKLESAVGELLRTLDIIRKQPATMDAIKLNP